MRFDKVYGEAKHDSQHYLLSAHRLVGVKRLR